jgi:beta-lactamase superfamily II metal-dependent hydrolase
MFRIHFLDVGQGDCTILQFENGRTYPKYTVISIGPNNYGHPEDWVLALVDEFTAGRVFRTDTNGTCIFESDGLGWRYRD